MGGVDEMFESILRPSNTYNTRNKPVIHFSRWGGRLSGRLECGCQKQKEKGPRQNRRLS